MSTYTVTIIYGWREGNLALWDEAVIEVALGDVAWTDKMIEEHVRTEAMFQWGSTIGQAMGGFAFAFIFGIDWPEPDVDEDPDHHAIPEDEGPTEWDLFGPEDTKDHHDE